MVDQRISQQNRGRLIQFGAKIVFSDNSSVQLNSLAELQTYNEVRPVVSTSVHLTFDYLVHFEDKTVPEKQQIQVSFIAAGETRAYFDSEIPRPLIFSTPTIGFVDFNIQHTARTWAADIESLLSNYAGNIIKSTPRFKKFVSNHSEKIALIVGSLFFLASLTGSFFATWSFSNKRMKQLNEFMGQHDSLSQEAINAKIDFVASSLTRGLWAQHYFTIFIFLLISFVLAISFGAWVETTAHNHESSFILLTKKSYEFKDDIIKKYNRKWKYFLLSFFLSISCGVIANFIFFLITG